MVKKIAIFFYSFSLLTVFPLLSQDIDHPSQMVESTTSEDSSPSRFISELTNMFFILGLLVALMLGVSWFVKRFLNTRMQQINVTSSIKILERRNLSPKSTIVLLEIAGKQVVIAESPSGICRIAEFSEKKTFNEIMEQ